MKDEFDETDYVALEKNFFHLLPINLWNLGLTYTSCLLWFENEAPNRFRRGRKDNVLILPHGCWEGDLGPDFFALHQKKCLQIGFASAVLHALNAVIWLADVCVAGPILLLGPALCLTSHFLMGCLP